ncbi:MAG: T9SS type A sorting domain-containing protein [Ginsengibacter sp.]
MKNIKSISLIALLLWMATLQTFAQSSLYVSSGANIFISGGTFFSVDSLVLNPSADFTITGLNTETKNTTITHPSPNPYIQRVFLFSSTIPSFTGAISIYYRDAELNGLPENALTLNVHDGVNWNAYNANVTRDATNNVVTTTALSNLNMNELTLANASGPLPVFFSLFNALCVAAGVKLSWKTAQEFNSKRFDIETSADAIQWSVAGSVNAAGTSNSERNYVFINSRSATNAFYRIVEYDINGKKIISSVITSSCSFKESFAVNPNPVHNAAIITIKINAATNVIFNLYDAKGALVKNIRANLLTGVNQIQLNILGLAKGTYTLSARWNNQMHVSKIVKE